MTIIGKCDVKHIMYGVTDKNNKVSVKGHHVHYH